jgi:hypothetical protein
MSKAEKWLLGVMLTLMAMGVIIPAIMEFFR